MSRFNRRVDGQVCISKCVIFYVFVIEKDGVADSDLEEEVIQHLKQLIRKQIGGFAVPEAFLVRLSLQ